MPKRLGVHISIAGGIEKAVERADALQCTTMQIFTHNPRGWGVVTIPEVNASMFRRGRIDADISPVFSHASYLINTASSDIDLLNRSIDMLCRELLLADLIGAEYVVLHPGRNKGIGVWETITTIKRSLSMVYERGEYRARILMENIAGREDTTGAKVGHLSEFLDCGIVAGICLDTCHAFASGYDIRTEDGNGILLNEIEEYIGIDRLRLIHLNDSKRGCGSGIDRHEHIGRGVIGIDGMRQFMNIRPFMDIPLILETPKETEEDDYMNLTTVKELLKGVQGQAEPAP